MNKQEDKNKALSCVRDKEDVVERLHPLCVQCPYGRAHEFCFPCWRYIMGQEGYH